MPIGSLMGEVFLKMLEESLFSSTHCGLDHVIHWWRYVDDVLCLWVGPKNALQDFLTHLHQLYPTIKFSMEVGDNAINYFDLTMSLRNFRHEFNIYRKTTATDTLIPVIPSSPCLINWPHLPVWRIDSFQSP